MPQKPTSRGVYILPNLLTTGSLLAGFVGLVMASQGAIEACALAILISAVLDGLDGKVARLTNSSSEFGIQYDSLADLVAFGVTPGFMVWEWMLKPYDRAGMAVSFLFVACTALRLARFNVSTAIASSKKFFIGLPSPAGGCALALTVFVSPYLPKILYPWLPHIVFAITFGVALLMVSRVRYFAFKEYGFLRAHPFRSMVITLLVVTLIYAEPRLFAPIACLLYMLSGLVYTFIILPTHNRRLLRSLAQNLS
ncbi:MAG: CDP-diacylglycerol--serine O-phosphatidyltransferase [Deltaproteobacteria bacterium]|jgi:CDP-diacylglycerol--serine O-phosphatidyltransferase|nr:CDP-diacylglycerol--serine O-phosphatidyltransferase [Deltaproteobacteria bacterium]